jgi:hypothetical protein
LVLKGFVDSQVYLDDTTAVCIPESHTGAVNAKSDEGDVHRTLEQLLDFSVSMLLIVVAAAASGCYCMLDTRLYVGRIRTDRIGL